MKSIIIILVISLAPTTVLATYMADCGDEPLYPETVTVDIEANAL